MVFKAKLLLKKYTSDLHRKEWHNWLHRKIIQFHLIFYQLFSIFWFFISDISQLEKLSYIYCNMYVLITFWIFNLNWSTRSRDIVFNRNHSDFFWKKQCNKTEWKWIFFCSYDFFYITLAHRYTFYGNINLSSYYSRQYSFLNQQYSSICYFCSSSINSSEYSFTTNVRNSMLHSILIRISEKSNMVECCITLSLRSKVCAHKLWHLQTYTYVSLVESKYAETI